MACNGMCHFGEECTMQRFGEYISDRYRGGHVFNDDFFVVNVMCYERISNINMTCSLAG